VQQSTSFCEAADQRNELGDEETAHGQQVEAEGTQPDQPAKTSRRSDGKKSVRHVAAQVRQEQGTTRDGDRREDRRESDRELRQLKTKVETLTQQMSALCAKFESAQPGQQQLQSNAIPAQASEQRQQASRPGGTFYNEQQSFFCYECGAPGHIARNCEMRRQRLTAQAPDQPPGRVQMVRQQPYVRARNDGTFGLGRRLQMRRPRRRPAYAYSSSSSSSSDTSETRSEDEAFAASKVYLPITVAGKSYGASLDTGCEVTVIPTKLVRRRQLQYTTRTLIAANGSLAGRRSELTSESHH